MRKKSVAFFSELFLIIMAIWMFGCAARQQTTVEKDDKTVVYPPKNEGDLSARIIFCRKINKITGKPVGAGTVFMLKEKEYLRALIEFENLPAFYNRELMLHLDWISPEGKSFFLKPVNFTPNDTVTSILSSISISPGTRQPGKYWLRIYFFRELIAEKQFELIPWAPSPDHEIKAVITLCQKVDIESGRPVMADSAFRIRKKGKVHALVDLDNLPTDDDVEYKFLIEWIESDTNTFFRKKFGFLPTEKSASLSSSISITPEKREAGSYYVRVFHSNQLLAEKKFWLYHD